MEALLSRLQMYESQVDYKTPPEPGNPAFRFRPGKLPILLSASHGTAHKRNGLLKEEDDYTAGLVLLVAEITGAHAIYTWRRSEDDPNYDTHSPYKKALRLIIRRYGIHFVLDIHGCAAYREFGLALGTNRGQSCPDQRLVILQVLEKQGFRPSGPWLSRVDIDGVFTGGGGQKQETITRYVSQKLNVPAAQLEINPYLRVVRRRPDATDRDPFEGEPQHILRLIRTLAALVSALANVDGKLTEFSVGKIN